MALTLTNTVAAQCRTNYWLRIEWGKQSMKKHNDMMKYHDCIFLGYPIWWDLAPRAVNTFIESNELTGKTVVPFATSGGSSITNSVAALKKTYPALKWKEGRLLNHADEKNIRSWIDKIEY